MVISDKNNIKNLSLQMTKAQQRFKISNFVLPNCTPDSRFVHPYKEKNLLVARDASWERVGCEGYTRPVAQMWGKGDAFVGRSCLRWPLSQIGVVVPESHPHVIP